MISQEYNFVLKAVPLPTSDVIKDVLSGDGVVVNDVVVEKRELEDVATVQRTTWSPGTACCLSRSGRIATTS
jgi:repressor of nif and glnA expression